MMTIPFPNADRELRLAWVADVDAALSEAESQLPGFGSIDRRVELAVDIAQVRASLAVERRLMAGEVR